MSAIHNIIFIGYSIAAPDAPGGPFGGGAAVNNSDAGDAIWNTPDNVLIDGGGTYSVSSLSAANTTTQYLHVTDFGFFVPDGATITGVEVSFDHIAGFGGGVLQDHTVQLIKGGTRSGDNKADTVTNWPSADTITVYGGASDMWSLTLTPADVNASNFGVAFRVQKTGGSKLVAAQYVTVTVHFTE